MKKIMILTTVYTGHGHKSVSDALTEQLRLYDDVQIDTVEAFMLIGDVGVSLSKMYGPMTRRARELWKIAYSLSNRSDKLLYSTMSMLIHDRFMRKMVQLKPDLIVTVHPMFNGSVINLLEHYGIDVPVISMQADIVNIHHAWCDPRSAMTLCPTREAYDVSLAMGMPAERLRQCGFPTRAQFVNAAREHVRDEYDGVRPLRCLIMSGGEGSGNMRQYAVELLNHFNCHVDIVCGRNVKLRRALEKGLGHKYGARVSVHGFVTDVEKYMLQSDLVIARGSPNSLMEAVVCNAPIMITGALPGQEADNPSLMVNHDLGVLCPEPEAVGQVVSSLIADGGRRLSEIMRAQREYRNFDNARDIAEYICSVVTPLDYHVPSFRLKYPSSAKPRKIRRAPRPTLRGAPRD